VEREAAVVVVERCAELAHVSEETTRLTRRFGTSALREAGEKVAAWMREAGMEVRRDGVGNVIGRRGTGARTLLLGSHIDTVIDAGRYDGPLGVLVAIEAVRAADALPFAVEIYAFADEEGVRFGTGYLASGAVAGVAPPLDALDAEGVRLGDLLDGDPATARRDPEGLLGYLEVHIEQGPVLESQNAPLGVVTGIAGQSRVTLSFEGVAGHAGTVPMLLRRDALAAAAEFVLAAEALARETDGLVATVGELSVAPGASNVIPAAARLSVDVRHIDDDVRTGAVERLRQRSQEISRERLTGHEWAERQSTPAVACDAELSRRLAPGAPRLPSGAGHDAAMMARIAPVAMLFVRCAGGISHNPAESVTLDDVAAAIEATTRFLRELR
jgi:allantoate deiminase